MKPRTQALLDAARWMLRVVEANQCHHQETHRGGAIWTICDGCGKKWADDEGGFRPYEEPAYIANMHDAICAFEDA